MVMYTCNKYYKFFQSISDHFGTLSTKGLRVKLWNHFISARKIQNNYTKIKKNSELSNLRGYDIIIKYKSVSLVVSFPNVWFEEQTFIEIK